MKRSVARLTPSFLITLCIYSLFGKVETVPPVIHSAEGEDSVTILGNFISPCPVPEKVEIWKYSVWDATISGEPVAVNKDGSFSYNMVINGPRQVGIKVNQVKLDFLVTLKEKIYKVEIACKDSLPVGMKVKNSYENKAFLQLYAYNKALTDSLKEIVRSSTVDENNFSRIKKQYLDYQQKVTSLSEGYAQSYTAQVLCPSEILPEQTLSSLNALRENYLNRDVFSNWQYYSTNFLVTGVLPAYWLLLGKKDTSFRGFTKALDIAGKNPETAKLLEHILYGSIYYRQKEQLLRGYINWVKLNPDKMLDLVVKAQLRNLESCMAGSQYTDITLNDPHRVPKKLSETLAGGKLTLLIFYSPTCAHCKETLPKIAHLWNQFKDKGLKIYAVGEDATDEEWLDFIKTKGTSGWTNVFNRDNGPESGVKYIVSAIPAFILIDERGIIITRFATFEYLKREIPKYFGE